jgi:HlyD family secretion protein
VLWKVENGVPTPVNVQAGLTDGLRTEIVSGDLKEGDVVAVASTSATGTKSAAAPAARSPFAAGGRGRGY